MKLVPLADADINRAAHIRVDSAALDSLWRNPNSMCAFVSNGDPVFASDIGALVWLPTHEIAPQVRDAAVFIGLDKADAGLFVADYATIDGPDHGLLEVEAQSFRTALGVLSPNVASILATARALLHWHEGTRYCGKCGAEMQTLEAGWKRVCGACGGEVFPRTDPVAIMLATHGDSCLLGRGANWPTGFMSCLAGFVEPGESVEQAACRELYEEAGIIARPQDARYLFSQPWPFPSSLMMGLVIEAQTTVISLNDQELEAAQWFPRAEVRQILAGTHADLFTPPTQAIAHHLIKAWAEG